MSLFAWIHIFLKYFMVKSDWQGRDRHKVQEENMVQRISIKGLFGYFDYEIHCGKKEFQF